jgi:transcriptional regulator with XRE-family HTH domain
MEYGSEEQKRIFAKNLNKYINLNKKQQIDVAKDLKVNTTTLNMWCKGNSMPNVGKILKIAEYFNVELTDLVNDKENDELSFEYGYATNKIAESDERFKKIVIAYTKMPAKRKQILCDFLEEFMM